MQYFLYPIILIAYFEILGRYIFMKLNKKPFEFSFIIGFLFVMAVLYLTSWPITAFNGSFYILLAYYIVLFLISLILIIKDFKKINFHFNIKMWMILLIFLVFGIFISSKRTLGDPHGFDQLYYINMMSFNIGNTQMNTLHPHFGTYPNTDVQWITYVFQSYYYFIPVLIYIFRTALSFIGMSFETLPAIVWGFQIVQSFIFIGTAILCIQELKDKSKLFNVAMAVLLILFLGNLYYNNVYGFIGNNYRMAIHAISMLFLFRYFNDRDKTWLYLFYMSMLGMCAVSSTGTFSFVFVLFGLFFVLYNREENILKHYAIVLFVPLVNIIITKTGQKWWVYAAILIFVIAVYLLNDLILKIYQNKAIRIGTLILVMLIFVIGSSILTKNLFNVDKFFTNYSEVQDMSWDYFDFYDYKHWIFNLIVLIPFFYHIFKNPRHPLSVISWVLIITFFNPLGSAMMNKINWVYYRSYDIIINQFTLIYFLQYFRDNLKLKEIYNVTILALSTILATVQIPSYWHETFVPDDDFNPIFKISNSELEVIYNVRQMIEDKNIKNPAIITSTFYMPSFIEGSTYLYGKEKRYNYGKLESNSYSLYLIFFPTGDYDNFRPDEEPQYKDVISLLKECKYDVLVLEYGLYAPVDDKYVPIVDLVEEDGTYQRSEYSTSKYAVYYLAHE